MRKSDSTRLKRMKGIAENFFEKSNERRKANKIINFELQKRGTKKLTPNIIDRILLNWNKRPVQHSPNTSYNLLATKKGLSNYMRAPENKNYTEQLTEKESELFYGDVYGIIN